MESARRIRNFVQSELLFQNLGRKKPQENDSQTLFESQENIFQKISVVFSQSSHSTNIGEMEDTLLQVMDSGNFLNEGKLEDNCSSYDLRNRSIIKQPKKRPLHAETFNSDISKSPRLEKTDANSSNENLEINQSFIVGGEDLDIENSSEESVSMLEGLYQSNKKNEFPELIETCINSEFEVISIYTDDEVEQSEKVDEEKTVLKVENSTQTNFSVPVTELTHQREIDIGKHAKFIKSVVKLKALLSSKEPVSDRKIWNILHNTMKGEKITYEEFSKIQHSQPVPKETIGYLIRSSDVENVFYETVQALLQHLEYALREDFFKIASCWKNSVYEMAVTMLSEAVDCEVGVWKMVDSFLCENIGSILKDAGKSKNFVLESKTNVILGFCQSTHLSYTAINFVIKKLEKLKIIKLNARSLTEKVSWAYLTKNSYFLLRILESSLDVLKGKIAGGKVEEIFVKKPEQKNYNVLEMWKKHWNKNEVPDEKKIGHDCEMVVSRWCTNLDEVLMHCINYIPVLSMVVERCGMLAKEILKLCHPEMMEDIAGKRIYQTIKK